MLDDAVEINALSPVKEPASAARPRLIVDHLDAKSDDSLVMFTFCALSASFEVEGACR
ncbi:hypothetical protein [Streptomyces sp. NPDC058092]|uniref:hypothetical protein n=1 Tax=Streptomyces sp. NPDC058092 TaxID=3346336 RepID=UPI0036E1A000